MSRFVRCVLLCSGLIAVAACNDSSGPATLQTRLGGRVTDDAIGKAISGVTVKICNYEKTASTDGDGHWSIQLSPGLQWSQIYLTFERSGYASTGRVWTLNPHDFADSNEDFEDTGTTTMRKGAPATVQVTRDGVPFGNASLFASMSGYYYDGSSDSDCTDLNILATTNASGVATLTNLDPDRYYMVVVPGQDTNGDNIPDTTWGSSQIHLGYYGSTYAIDVHSTGPDPYPDITGTNLAWFQDNHNSVVTGPIDGTNAVFPYGMSDLPYRQYNYGRDEVVSIYGAVVTPNHSVQVVFWTPVDISVQNFRYHNNLVPVADPAFDQDISIPATATVLSGSNFTIYNFIPSVPLPAQETVTLNFIARSRTAAAYSENLSVTFYVPLGLQTITLGADNFNGSRDGSGGYNRIRLRFAEVVDGFYKVISYTEDGTTYTYSSPFEQWVDNSGSFFPYYYFSRGYIVNNEVAAPATGQDLGQSGALAGKQFLVDVYDQDYQFVYLNDDVPGTTVNSIRVEVSLRNIMGVTLDGIFDLPVE